MSVTHPCVFARRSKVLVEVSVTKEKPNDQGKSEPPAATEYVGMLSAEDEKQTPQRLVEGYCPPFWSTDGKVIYTDSKRAIVSAADQSTKATAGIVQLGKRQSDRKGLGVNSMFLESRGASAVVIVSLDGNRWMRSSRRLLPTFPLRDSDGGTLRSIDAAGPNQVIGTYDLRLWQPLICPADKANR